MSPSKPTAEEIERKPWRYEGYPRFSKWMASENDFFVLRRFDNLAARVLLQKQWEISKIEAKLAKLDYSRSHDAPDDFHNGSFECDTQERRSCIQDIQKELREYCT
jgi:hypothetical protein